MQLKEQTELPPQRYSILAFDCQVIEGCAIRTNINANNWTPLGSLAKGKIGRNFNEKGIEKQIQTVIGHYYNEKFHSEWNIQIKVCDE